MSDLSHTNAGKIQSEDVDFRAAVDPVAPKTMGHNINYLKDGFDQNNIDVGTALTNKVRLIGVSGTNLTMNSSHIIHTLDETLYPGKEILCAIVNIIHPSGYKPPFAMCVFRGGVESSRVMYSGVDNRYRNGGVIYGGQFFASIVQGPNTLLYNSVQVRCKGTITGNYTASGVAYLYV